MEIFEKSEGLVFGLENLNIVAKQVDNDRHNELLEKTYTMVQKNKHGDNEVTNENIRNWARYVFKR